MATMKTKKHLLLIVCFLVFSWGWAQQFTLADFYSDNSELNTQVDAIFNSLNDTTRVAQMLVTSAGELGKPESVVLKLASENKIGGVVFLKGTKANHKRMIDSLNSIAKSQLQLPLLFSDHEHPNDLGYKIMAKAWFEAIIAKNKSITRISGY